MRIAVVGAGRVGTSLAVRWREAGHDIVAVAGGDATPDRARRFLPGVPVLDPIATARGAEAVVIATPDGAIASVATTLAEAGAVGASTSVIHASGATGLDALEGPRAAGAGVLSVHPLQTCPTVEAALERLSGAGFAVTAEDESGFALGERLARDAGGRPFRVDDDVKPLYHAAAVFASNYLVTVTALAHELERASGIEDPASILGPLQSATLDNVERVGPGEALTGPAVRGDAGTVERNLEALAKHLPEAIGPYVVLADLALALAERAGRLPADGRDAVDAVLARWR